MSIAEDQDLVVATVPSARKPRRRRLLAIVLAIATAQYTIVAAVVGTTVAGVMHFLVPPQVVASFEAIAAALKH